MLIKKKKKVLAVDRHAASYKVTTITFPTYIFSYMSLYCLAKSKSKSKIIAELVDNWYTAMKEKEPQEKLAQDVIELSIESYKKMKLRNPTYTLIEFREELRKELIERSLNAMQVNVIIKGVV